MCQHLKNEILFSQKGDVWFLFCSTQPFARGSVFALCDAPQVAVKNFSGQFSNNLYSPATSNDITKAILGQETGRKTAKCVFGVTRRHRRLRYWKMYGEMPFDSDCVELRVGSVSHCPLLSKIALSIRIQSVEADTGQVLVWYQATIINA